MATSGEKKKKEKYVQAKTYLVSPFTPKWRSIPQEDMHFILNTIKDKLVSVGLQKKEEKVFRPWKKKKAKNPSSVPEVTQVVSAQDSPHRGWTNAAARGQLAIGINEVTKALERNELKLVLVCKSVRPKHMTDHLIALSATRGVLACQVPRLSQSMSEPLGLKSVLALGFKNCTSRDDDMFTDTVTAISPRIPPLGVHWLPGGALQGVKPDEPCGPEGEDGEDGNKKKGEKRKLQSQPEVTESTSSSSLQPLTVKQTVPNPAKKIKTKAKS
ncbi:ribonuclease P protein subunit p38 [Halichoeres trimaculatus]|uniref:ribonuclease P protein subunit p38 n=1 Tax=Halichoeres trimaculatus TaxID=147232 RepID=UPI003D9EB9ED